MSACISKLHWFFKLVISRQCSQVFRQQILVAGLETEHLTSTFSQPLQLCSKDTFWRLQFCKDPRNVNAGFGHSVHLTQHPGIIISIIVISLYYMRVCVRACVCARALAHVCVCVSVCARGIVSTQAKQKTKQKTTKKPQKNQECLNVKMVCSEKTCYSHNVRQTLIIYDIILCEAIC